MIGERNDSSGTHLKKETVHFLCVYGFMIMLVQKHIITVTIVTICQDVGLLPVDGRGASCTFVSSRASATFCGWLET